jgi:hypothetical protein
MKISKLAALVKLQQENDNFLKMVEKKKKKKKKEKPKGHSFHILSNKQT